MLWLMILSLLSILAAGLQPKGSGLFLASLCGAELFAWATTAATGPNWMRRRSRRFRRSGGPGPSVLSVWVRPILALVVVSGALISWHPPLFHGDSFLLKIFLTLCFVRSVSFVIWRERAQTCGRAFAASVFYLCGTVAFTTLAAHFRTPTAGDMMMLALLSATLNAGAAVLVLAAFGSESRRGPDPEMCPKLHDLALKWCDMPAVVLLLDAPEAATYLIARLIALPLCGVPAWFYGRFGKQLAHMYGLEDASEFRSAAARLNLAMMLMGGAVAVLLLIWSSEPFAAIGPGSMADRQVLVWICAGLCAPVIFGATDLLLDSTGRGMTRCVIDWLFAILILVAILTAGVSAADQLARCFAVGLFAWGGASAFLVVSTLGIWPGLTALLHGQLRVR